MMIEKLRSCWQKITQHWRIAVVAILLALFVVIVLGYLLNWHWTGLVPETSEPKQHEKTLWDWLQLLFIPAVLTLGAVWFTARQNHDREIAFENQHEAALQGYIDSMSELLLKEHLDERTVDGQLKPKYRQVRNVARVRTVTTLSRLDSERKGRVLHFLYESDLIMKGNKIVDLSYADLSNANLVQFDKSGADLSGTDLSGANLSGAKLIGTDLSGANLSRAKLQGANLSEADLSGADLKDALYNTKRMQWMNAQGIPLTLERTEWPQEFPYKSAGLICVDC